MEGTAITTFGSDTTLRWPCRKGDYVLWARFQGIFSGDEYKIADVWELRDGNFITITNRDCDLPEWFDLHPLEVSGSLVWRMKQRLDQGYVPQEPVEGPNIWRVFAGDRIVWVGPSRGGIQSQGGVLGIVDFRENALIYGEPFDFSTGLPTFGGFDQGQSTQEGVRLCRIGWDALKRLKPPRAAGVDDQWRIG